MIIVVMWMVVVCVVEKFRINRVDVVEVRWNKNGFMDVVGNKKRVC